MRLPPLSILAILAVLQASDMRAHLPTHSKVRSVARSVEINELKGWLVAFVVAKVGHYCRWNSSGKWHMLTYVSIV